MDDMDGSNSGLSWSRTSTTAEMGLEKSTAWKTDVERSRDILVGIYQEDKIKEALEDTNGKVCILGFDLDHTLIKPRSHSKFAKDKNDWTLLYRKDLIRDKIREMQDRLTAPNRPCVAVVFSNQKYVAKPTVPKSLHSSDLREKAENILKSVGIPMVIVMATGSDRFRKPRTGMVGSVEDLLGKSVDSENSLYIGDAAGRAKDFAATDLKFALNLKWKFQAPETFFRNETVRIPDVFDFDPRIQLTKSTQSGTVLDLVSEFLKNTYDHKESPKPLAVFLIGAPGSGKSHVSNFLKKSFEFSVICQDELKTMQRCERVWDDCLSRRRLVCLDRQNERKTIRQNFIEKATKHHYTTIGIFLDFSIEVAKHGNEYRKVANRPSVPPMVISKFFKTLEPPTESEFDNLLILRRDQFQPGPFDNLEQQNLFCSFLV